MHPNNLTCSRLYRGKNVACLLSFTVEKRKPTEFTFTKWIVITRIYCHHCLAAFYHCQWDRNMSSSVWSVAFDISHLLNKTATSNAMMAHASTNNLACSYSDAHKSLQWQKQFMWICCYLFSVFWINFRNGASLQTYMRICSLEILWFQWWRHLLWP